MMQATLLLSRMRSHLARSLVVAAVFAVAAGTAMSALAVRAVADDPWAPLRAATNGGDVEVDGSLTRPDRAALAELPDVAEVGALLESGGAALRLGGGGEVLLVSLLGMPERDSMVVDRPVLTAGRWLSTDGEVVFETTMADMLGVRVGDRVTLTGAHARTVTVVGTAATAMMPTYPERLPGTVFTGQALFDAIDPVGPRRWTIGLRLHDPARADQVAAGIARGNPQVRTAASIRDNAFPTRTRAFAEFVLLFAALMLIAAVMLVVTLLGSRLVSEARELTLLQVGGLTPARLAWLIAAEQAVPATVGVAAGVPIALVAAPFIAESATVLGTITPTLTPMHVAIVGGGAIAVCGIVSAVAGLRAGRRSLALVARGASGPVHRSPAAGLALAATRWPTLVLGLKDIATRRGRAATNVLGVALAVTMAVAIVAIATTTTTQLALPPSPTLPGQVPADITQLPDAPAAVNGDIVNRIAALTATMQLLLGAIALLTLLAAAAMSMRERVRELGVLHALGCTTGQLAGAAAISHAALGALGAVIGVPAGVGFYLALMGLGTGAASGSPPLPAIALVALAAVAISAAAGAAPVALAHRIPASVALATE